MSRSTSAEAPKPGVWSPKPVEVNSQHEVRILRTVRSYGKEEGHTFDCSLSLSLHYTCCWTLWPTRTQTSPITQRTIRYRLHLHAHSLLQQEGANVRQSIAVQSTTRAALHRSGQTADNTEPATACLGTALPWCQSRMSKRLCDSLQLVSRLSCRSDER